MTIIHVLIIFCKKQKNQNFRRFKINVEKKQISIFLFINLSKTLSMKCKIIQCIFCFDNKNLSIFDRLKTFTFCDDFKKHFLRKHFRYHSND